MIRNQFSLDIYPELIVDNFAGGGGASTGIELALGRNVDIAINHDREAVAMHTANHPQTRHYCEDVFSINPVEITSGRPVGLAWFSPDCKHFSKAKGGKPRSKKIRGLAWVTIRWAATVQPRVIMLENVEEFKTWGPLLRDGTPCPKRKGQTFVKFVSSLRDLGYQVDFKELRASAAGSPTIRKRLFLIARCDGRPIVWPDSCDWNPRAKRIGGKLKAVRTAAECIDWSIPCPSIFERKRPLAENTLRRIARGLFKFVINSPSPFIVKVNHTAEGYTNFRGQGLDEPMQTVTGHNGYALVGPILTEHANASKQRNFSADEPLRTQCSEVKGGHFALVNATLEPRFHCKCGENFGVNDYEENCVTCPKCGSDNLEDITDIFQDAACTLIQTGYGERKGQAPRAPGIDKPLGTVVAGGQKHAIVAAFLAKHFTGVVGSEVSEPIHTITATDHNALVSANLIRHFGSSVGNGVDTPMGTIMAGGSGKTGLITSNLIKLKGACKDGQPVTEPLHTVQAGGKHYAEVRAFLIKYYGQEKDGVSLNDPMHTITGKDRVGLVTVAGEEYVITDIGMRMLEPHELYTAQGFPPDYIIAPEVNGKRISKAAQVRMCGNSVCPPQAAALVAANVPELSAWEKGERAA